jgi:hypothetical protein
MNQNPPRATTPAPAVLLPAALLGGLLLSPALAAQDAGEEPDRWAAEAALSLNSSGGNQSLTLITTELGLTHLRTDAYELDLGTRFRYGRSNGEDVAQDLSGSVTLDLWPAATWSPFLFATGEKDPFRRLEVRVTGGAGLKRTFWQEDWNEASLSAAVLYSYENLELADSMGDGVTQTARWSGRGRVRREIREGTRFEQVVFFQPAWDRLADYLLESRSTGRVALSEALAVTASVIYERDSTPAPEVEPDDWSVALGLSLATRW